MQNDIYQLAYNLLQTNMSPQTIFEHCIKISGLISPDLPEAQTILNASAHFAAAYRVAVEEWQREAEAAEAEQRAKEEAPIMFMRIPKGTQA